MRTMHNKIFNAINMLRQMSRLGPTGGINGTRDKKMKKILVVDDELPMRTILHELLCDDYQVTLAADGQEAKKLLGSTQFDLIITDLVMPEMNGIDLITFIKALSPNLKIIAMSGGGGINGRFDYLPVAQLIGAEKIFSKPFELSKMQETIKEVLA